MASSKSPFSRVGWRWRYLLVPVAATTLVAGIDFFVGDTAVAPAAALEWGPAGYGPASYAQAQELTGQQLALGRERVRNGPGEWLRQESLARALIARSRLSASYNELAQARQVLAEARTLAPPPSGPLLTDAALAMMTHRLADTEATLALLRQSAAPERQERAEVEALAGDIRFYRGDFAAARAYYRRAERIDPTANQNYRRAILAKSGGDFERAIELLRAAEPAAGTAAPFQHASTAMQIGAVEMARGDYEAARGWFARADETFPGYWLFEAHLAQAKALDGDLHGAIGDLRRIASTSGSAEVMDALAIYLREAGADEESRRWADRAATIWERRLQQLPEASYGHAFEHELAFGSPERALWLARRNLSARPYGEARVMIGEALLLNGKPRAALAELNTARRSGWRSAPLFALLAEAYEALDQTDRARSARHELARINPRFSDDDTVLIRFSHP